MLFSNIQANESVVVSSRLVAQTQPPISPSVGEKRSLESGDAVQQTGKKARRNIKKDLHDPEKKKVLSLIPVCTSKFTSFDRQYSTILQITSVP